MNDDDFVQAFFDCRLAGNEFDHRGHLRVAWLLLQRFPISEAIERTCNGIARIAAHFGAPDKYNRTMSEALVRLIAAARHNSGTQTLEQFLEVNPMFATNARGVLANYYSHERLTSPDAKRQFVEPDLRALP